MEVAFCVNVLAVPVSVIFVLPGVALEATDSMICPSVPGVKVSVEGVAVTPVGSVLSVTCTGLENPFAGTAITVIAWGAPPGVIDIVDGAASSVKVFEALPPHPASIEEATTASSITKSRFTT